VVTATFSAALIPPADLLAALVAYLRHHPGVLAAFGGGPVPVFDNMAAAGTDPPFLVVDAYTEVLPGESAEDQMVTASVLVRAAGLDQCRAIAAAVKAALDTPACNPAAPPREPLAWQGGEERTALRDHSRPQRLPGIARGGPYGYREQVDYEFWVTPSQ
jgi:hypothetical protein